MSSSPCVHCMVNVWSIYGQCTAKKMQESYWSGAKTK